ncbi:MAG: hypothetical protein M1832_003227 [Thelocarpon impressellum]|nr:MAG: hypothetical protein M1832_003227 [Thelocarpon impressellum]
MARQMQRAGIALLSILVLGLSPDVLAADTCYWPSSSPANAFVPCNVNPSDSGPRPCCGKGEVCLSNAACFSTAIGVIYRGACTDQTWQSNKCPRFFLEEHPNYTANMFSCLDGTFRTDPGRCSDGDNFRYSGASLIGLVSATAPATTSRTDTASSGSTSSTGTDVACPSAVNAQTSTGCRSKGDMRRIGLGVGLGLGLPLLAALAAVAVLLRSNRRFRANTKQDPATTIAAAGAGASKYPRGYGGAGFPPPQPSMTTTTMTPELGPSTHKPADPNPPLEMDGRDSTAYRPS